MMIRKKDLSCPSRPSPPYTLSVDVGGSRVKAAVLDSCGRMASRRLKEKTPRSCKPKTLLKEIQRLAKKLPEFHRVAVGFPGVVKNGRIVNAPNLGSRAWEGYDLARAVAKTLGRPAKVLNDADMQGISAISGKGIELVVTLGTGVGTSLFRDGELLPKLELGMAFHPVEKGRSYNEYIGDKARRKLGDKEWNRRVKRFVKVARQIVHYDRIYLGGGNAKRLSAGLGPRAKIVANRAGVLGGAHLWHSPKKRR